MQDLLGRSRKHAPEVHLRLPYGMQFQDDLYNNRCNNHVALYRQSVTSLENLKIDALRADHDLTAANFAVAAAIAAVAACALLAKGKGGCMAAAGPALAAAYERRESAKILVDQIKDKIARADTTLSDADTALNTCSPRPGGRWAMSFSGGLF